MKKMNIRKKCPYCGIENIEELFKIKMPLFMGSVEYNINYDYSDMTFLSCNNCNNVFLKELINPKLLYKNNHNRVIVGDTWKTHYDDFINFIGDVKNKRILEVGDPSFKLAKRLYKKTEEYTVVEYNIDKNIDGINVINKYFDENFDEGEKYDIILNSHFMEHVFNPKKVLKKINNMLLDDGEFIFSIPNLEYLLENNYILNNIIQFEHTYFYTITSMINLLNNVGLDIVEIKKYRKHSIFFKVVKKQYKSDIVKNDINIKKMFIESYNNGKEKVKKINNYISEHKEEIYLFGCHVSSQYLISNGLLVDKIDNILDNSEDKNKKYLYGTSLKSVFPEKIKNDKTPLVICSHMSVYFNEIRDNLKKINKNVIII